ncbi:MAG: hypothetical protein U0457_08125 [Candidatus Sericytochromatia bacterium]
MLKSKSKIFLSMFLSINLLVFSNNFAFAEEKKINEDSLDLDDIKKEEPKKTDTKKKNTEKDEESLDDLLNSDINAGSTGSFGYALNKFTQDLGIEPYIHAYTTFDAMKVNSKPFTFDSRYYNLFLGVNIKDVISSELQIENEHSGTEYEVRVGQIDLLINPLFNFRVGRFLVPIGTFNSYLYPEYITKGVDRPFALREIIPVTWSDNGVEIFGKYEFGINKNINYTLYAINGLKQAPVAKDSDLKDGGSIRAMRGNVVENDKSDKGLGGRLGIVPIDGLELSLSAYSGSYTADATKKLNIADIDLAYELGTLNIRGEYVYAIQQASKGDITKQGGYGQISYLFKPIEPVLRYDLISFNNDTTQDRQRILAGINYYPFYDTYKKLVLKLAYTYTIQKDLKEPNSFYFQTSLGF